MLHHICKSLELPRSGVVGVFDYDSDIPTLQTLARPFFPSFFVIFAKNDKKSSPVRTHADKISDQFSSATRNVSHSKS